MEENQRMPLPNAPTRRPNNAASRQSERKSNNALLFKAILLALIGLGVLLSHYFINSPGLQGIVVMAVGWFALVLGGTFLALYVKRRLTAQSKP